MFGHRIVGFYHDLCLAAELFLQPHVGKEWLLSGKLYEILYLEPTFM